VLVGVAGLNLSRDDFYEKELSFRVSCSYGPGRYDPDYEEKGQDYPLAHVRWTEKRNFQAVLDLIAAGTIETKQLVTHRFALQDAEDAYEVIVTQSSPLGVLIKYASAEGQSTEQLRLQTVELTSIAKSDPMTPAVGFIGAGNFAKNVLMPAFRDDGVRLVSVASEGGFSAMAAARKFGFAQATTDSNQVIASRDVNIVAVASRHDTHADFVCQALREGKHVFTEKPLAINSAQLQEINDAYESTAQAGACPILMVGFNRRFAPQIAQIRSLLRTVCEPKSFIMTVNSTPLPPDHWGHDPGIGGGLVVGEGCHFVDLLRFLCGHQITRVHASMLGGHIDSGIRTDKVTITMEFADGSFGTIHYLANGHRAFPKERLEVFCGGKILQLDNFRTLRGYGWKRFRKMQLWRQDKGHVAGVEAFLEAVRHGKPSPIPWHEIAEVSRVSLDVIRSAESGQSIRYPNKGVVAQSELNNRLNVTNAHPAKSA
jgi:predicted dehydrogenase